MGDLGPLVLILLTFFHPGLGTMWSASGAWTPAVYWNLGPLTSPEQEKDI